MKLDLKDLPAKALELLTKLKRYGIVLFLLLVVGSYSFMVLSINRLQSIAPKSTAPAKGTVVATPHIDPQVIKQLQQLQDNSVSVKTLFDQARSNPFQE